MQLESRSERLAGMAETGLEVPRAWEQLSLDRLRGTLMVIGDTDVGKSTLACYLYRRLCEVGRRAAFLDGDPGQSALGPPTTMTAALGAPGDPAFPPRGQARRWFVGSVSPSGHLTSVVVGAARLVRAVCGAGAEVVVYDTCGLVSPANGGIVLKLAKIDLLCPSAVFALERHAELEGLLSSLRRSRRARVIDLQPSPAVQPRDVATRQAHRAAQFARYFADARPLPVEYARLAVLPPARFSPHGLVALEDASGFALGLGIVLDHDPDGQTMTLLTPLESLEGVDALHPGDVMVDPTTFRDQRLDG